MARVVVEMTESRQVAECGGKRPPRRRHTALDPGVSRSPPVAWFGNGRQVTADRSR